MSEVTQRIFGPAEFDFEIYFSVRCNAHAQRTIFGQIKAFNANRRVPRRFLDARNLILRSILVFDATRIAGEDFYPFYIFCRDSKGI